MGGDGKGQLDRRIATGTPCRPDRKRNRKLSWNWGGISVFSYFSGREEKINK